MKNILTSNALLVISIVWLCKGGVSADTDGANQANATSLGNTFYACACNRGDGEIIVFDTSGEIVWRHKPPKGPCLDFQILPNGNVLFVTGRSVMEITPDKKVVLDFDAKQNVVSCRRLADGNTLVNLGNLGKVLHVSPDATIAKEVKIQTGKSGSGLGHTRLLENGNYLVGHYTGKKLREYAPDGSVKFEFAVPGGAFGVQRLPNGNTLVGVTDKKKDAKIIEVTPEGKIAWEFSNKDIPSEHGKDPLKFVAGIHRMPNGNILLANWQGHWLGWGKREPFPHIWEITPDKKIIKAFQHPKLKNIVAVQALDAKWAENINKGDDELKQK